MNHQINGKFQPFTPAVSSVKSTLSSATCASAPSTKSSTSTYSIHLQRNFGLSDPSNKSSNILEQYQHQHPLHHQQHQDQNHHQRVLVTKTPSPPQQRSQQFASGQRCKQGLLADCPSESSSRLKLSTNAKTGLLSSSSSLCRDSVEIPTRQYGDASRLFQTPSQTTNSYIDRSLGSSTNKTTRLQRLQATGILDKIKNMHLNDSVDTIDEHEEDNYSSGKSSCATTVKMSSSEGGSTYCEKDVKPGPFKVDSKDPANEKGNPVHENELNANSHDDSVVIVEEKTGNIDTSKYTIQKKFTFNTPCFPSAKKKSLNEGEKLHQTKINEYFRPRSDSNSYDSTPHQKATCSNLNQVQHVATTVDSAVQAKPPDPLADFKKRPLDTVDAANDRHFLTSSQEAMPPPPARGLNQVEVANLHFNSNYRTLEMVRDKPAPPPVLKNTCQSSVQSNVDKFRTPVRETSENKTPKPLETIENKPSNPPKPVETVGPNPKPTVEPVAAPKAGPVSILKAPSESYSCQSTPSNTDQQSKKSTTKELKTVKVNGKSYFYLSNLGQGGSSKVYQVYDPVNQRNCALKIVDLKNADESIRAGYENEITLLTKLNECKRVVKLYDFERLMSPEGTVRRLLLVMEKGDADLNQILRNSIEKDPDSPSGLKIDPHTIKFYWKEMLKAVDEIHQKDVVHADLKPVNFITVSGKLKLIDFGIANAIETDHTSVIKDNQIGTINFMAPEALFARSDITQASFNKPMIKFNCKADIWSLGCILYNLVYGKSPFSQFNSTYAKIQAICNPQHIIEFAPISDLDLLDCLKKCLQRNPKKRPSAQELLKHPYLTRTGSSCTSVSNVQPSVGAQNILKDIVNKMNTLTPNRLNEVSKLVHDLSRK